MLFKSLLPIFVLVFCLAADNIVLDTRVQEAAALNNARTQELDLLSSAVKYPWQNLLTSAPLSIFLLGQLVVIAAKRDFNLTFKVNLPYTRLRHRTFRPTLIQVCNEGWVAFNDAHGNMDAIRMHMALIPHNVRSVLRIMSGQVAPAQVAQFVPIPLGALQRSADECVRLTNATYNSFYNVQLLLNEVSEVLAATQGESDEQLRQRRADIEAAEYEKTLVKKREEEAAARFNKINAELDKGRKMFEQALDDIPTGFKQFGLELLRGLVNMLTFGFLGSAEHRGGITEEIQESFNEASVDDDVLLDRAEKINNHLSMLLETFDLEGNFTFNYLTTLSIVFPAFVRDTNGRTSKHLEPVSKLVSGCLNVVSTMLASMRNSSAMATAKTTAAGLLQTAKSLLAHKTTKNAGAQKVRSKTSPTGSMSNERFRALLAKKRCDQLQLQHTQMLNRLLSENQRLQNIMIKMSRLNMDTINFQEILEILKEAIAAVATLKEKWAELMMFFQHMSNTANMVVGHEVRKFAEYTNVGMGGTEKAEFLMTALKEEISETVVSVARVSNFLHSVSSAYVNVSEAHLMARLASLSRLLTAQSPTEQSNKLKELQQQSVGVQKQIKQICVLHQQEFEGRVAQERMKIDAIFTKVGQPTVGDMQAVEKGAELDSNYLYTYT